MGQGDARRRAQDRLAAAFHSLGESATERQHEHASAHCRILCGVACCADPALRPAIPEQAGQGDRAVRRRRAGRRGGADGRAEAVGEARPAVRDREPGRRRRQHRHGQRRARRARRLHDPVRVVELRGQSVALRQDPLRSVQGSHPDHGGRRHRKHVDRAPFGAGQTASRS